MMMTSRRDISIRMTGMTWPCYARAKTKLAQLSFSIFLYLLFVMRNDSTRYFLHT